MHITERRQGPGRDAGPSEDQPLLQIDTDAAERRMVIFRLETELAELNARKAAAEAALAQSHRRDRESAGNLGASPSSNPPRERRSPRKSPSPPAEVAAFLQILQIQQQMQQQQAADQRREENRREERREEQRREDRREAAERAERLEERVAEQAAILEARLLQSTSATVGGPASTSGFTESGRKRPSTRFRSSQATTTSPSAHGTKNSCPRPASSAYITITYASFA